MKCIICKKEIKRNYAAADLCGTYCLECATKLNFVDKSAKNDFKEGFKEGLAQKQFDKDAEIMQLKQQLKKFQSIKEYRVNKLLVKNKKLKQQLALTEKALEERGKELLTFANRISEQNKEIFDLRSRLISKTLKGE